MIWYDVLIITVFDLYNDVLNHIYFWHDVIVTLQNAYLSISLYTSNRYKIIRYKLELEKNCF